MSTSRKPKRPVAASKKTSVQISIDNEALVRNALAGLDLPAERGQQAASSSGNGKAATKQAREVYDALARHGFKQEHIQQALQALAGGDLSEGSSLDWLCMHIDPALLPRRFAAGARSHGAASGIKLVAAAREGVSAPGRQAWDDDEEVVPAVLQPVEPAKREKDVALDKDAQRRWIMQYMEAQSSSGEDDEEAADDGPGKGVAALEDWELWADPGAVERRRAERKRAGLPPDERRALVAAEFAGAKAEAARAKAAGDKQQQRAAGQLIRDLKAEMQQLGMSEEVAEQLAGPRELPQPQPPAAPPSAPPAASRPARRDDPWGDDGDDDWLAGGADDVSSAPQDNWEALDVLDALGGGQAASVSGDDKTIAPEAAKPGARGKSPSDDDDDVGPGGLGMFDEEAAAESAWQAPQPAARRPEPLAPLGGYAAGPRKKGKPGKKPAAAPQAEARLPKAVLQQLCQRLDWKAPRFERMDPGGLRLPDPAIRYAVVLEPNVSGKGGKRRGKKEEQPRRFALHEEDDGWEAIQEAQNAAATRALYEVSEERELASQLASPFRELWDKWDAEGDDVALRQLRAAADERDAFLQSLLTGSGQNGGSNGAAGSSSGSLAAAAGDAGEERAGGAEEAAAAPSGPAEPSARTRAESARMAGELAAWRASEEGARWAAQRGGLPVTQIRARLLEALRGHDVAVVSGDTGCGKTTQVPQYLLEEATEAGRGGECSIICTQPRRLAAISVAERVANERGEPQPGSAGGRVGYHVRLDAATTAATRLLFCTTGILLRRLAGDPTLSHVSHVVVDEVHERTLQGDFLMALLRQLQARRAAAGRPLKVVLMSATLDSALFASYFGACPVLAAGGRTFPVQHFFLEDAYERTGYRLDAEGPSALRGRRGGGERRQLEKSAGSKSRQALVKTGWGDDAADSGVLNKHYDPELYGDYSQATRRNLARVDEDRIDFDLLEALVGHIDSEGEEGAILVFLPGMGEISNLVERLTGSPRFRGAAGSWVIPLHSAVSPAEQRRAFQRPPPGLRKVVVATNIAETSLTIEDVVYVVDSGKLKERRYDPSRGMSLLVEDWVSRANALQRRGRAGRVRPGQCFGLYTRQRFEGRMRKFQAPEMVRVPLEELVLQIHLLKLGPAEAFLGSVLEPPAPRSIRAALDTLSVVGALTPDEQLTPLGHHLAQLPVDARVGKLLVLAAALGCLAPALTVAAAASHRSPFAGGFDQQDAAQRAKLAMAASGSGNLASGQQSDHLLVVAAYDAWAALPGPRERREYTRRQQLSDSVLATLADMRWQFAEMLADSRLAGPPGGGGGRRGSRAWVDDPKAPWNRYAAVPSLVKAVLCAALYPNIAVMDGQAAGGRPQWRDGGDEVFLHPSSVNHPLPAAQLQRPYLVYLEKVRTSRVFLRDTSIVSPMTLLLFGGELTVVHEGGYVLVDSWLRIRAAAPTAVLVKKLRAGLDALLEARVRAPGAGAVAGGDAVVEAIVKLLVDEERDHALSLA